MSRSVRRASEVDRRRPLIVRQQGDGVHGRQPATRPPAAGRASRGENTSSSPSGRVRGVRNCFANKIRGCHPCRHCTFSLPGRQTPGVAIRARPGFARAGSEPCRFCERTHHDHAQQRVSFAPFGRSERIAATGGNQILASCRRTSAIASGPSCNRWSWSKGTSCYEANAPVEHVYFIDQGMISVVSDMQNGDSIEVGTIGNEGMAGNG